MQWRQSLYCWSHGWLHLQNLTFSSWPWIADPEYVAPTLAGAFVSQFSHLRLILPERYRGFLCPELFWALDIFLFLFYKQKYYVWPPKKILTWATKEDETSTPNWCPLWRFMMQIHPSKENFTFFAYVMRMMAFYWFSNYGILLQYEIAFQSIHVFPPRNADTQP